MNKQTVMIKTMNGGEIYFSDHAFFSARKQADNFIKKNKDKGGKIYYQNPCKYNFIGSERWIFQGNF